MIRYSTNWMGPVNAEWVRKHGEHWAGGRIDIRGGDLDEHGTEIGVRTMHGEDWLELNKFCDGLKTESVLSPEDFWKRFEKFLGREARWWHESD